MPNIDLSVINANTPSILEAFKTLRTNISFCGADIKIIAVTSAFPNEGKSETALRLAYAFAETGAKTILVDADIRNSTLAGKLGANGISKGLSHVLSGKESSDSPAICKTDLSSLDIIFAGPTAPNPAELLGKEPFRNLLEILRNKYDYIIVDCPPVMPVIDAAIIARECDGTLLVVSQNRVRKSDAKKTLDQLKLSGANMLGVVLNKVAAKEQGYGYGYGYGYSNTDNEDNK